MAHDHHDHDDPHAAPLTETQLRVRALESLLTEKGLVDPRALDELIETYETRIGPRNGAQVVVSRRPMNQRSRYSSKPSSAHPFSGSRDRRFGREDGRRYGPFCPS